jgi:SynChlorMet cassette protein ScmC
LKILDFRLKVKIKKNKIYLLKLANGIGYQLTATGEAAEWLDKLASIMELNTCSKPNGYPKQIFIGNDSGGDLPYKRYPGLNVDFPGEDWRLHDLKALQLWYHTHNHDVFCRFSEEEGCIPDIIRMWQALAPIYLRVKKAGGLPFHAGLAERKGQGILIAGHGDTGKSTCCRRLPHPWRALCDDETLIVRDSGNKYLAHPFPTWSDFLDQRSSPSWNVQQHIPLAAIFFLEQAEKDEVLPMREGNAAIKINQAAAEVCRRNWRNMTTKEERLAKTRVFENACELAKAIPAYKLCVSLTGRFWDEMERVIE